MSLSRLDCPYSDYVHSTHARMQKEHAELMKTLAGFPPAEPEPEQAATAASPPKSRKRAAPSVKKPKAEKKTKVSAQLYPVPECCKDASPVRYCCMKQGCEDAKCNLARLVGVYQDIHVQVQGGIRMSSRFDGFKVAKTEFGIEATTKRLALRAIDTLYPELLPLLIANQ